MAVATPMSDSPSTRPEDIFVKLFTQVFGLARVQLLSFQHPFEDMYGGNREIDYALRTVVESPGTISKSRAVYRLTASFEYIGAANFEQADVLGVMDCRDG